MLNKIFFFLSQAPTRQDFTFNWVRLSKTACEIFQCQFRFIFFKHYIFAQQHA